MTPRSISSTTSHSSSRPLATRIAGCAAIVGLAAALQLGCNVHVSDNNGDSKHADNVDINSPLGALKVRTDDVDPRNTGMSVYPNSRPKPKDSKDDNKADVNIDTPWFAVKVVAITYVTDDPMDKVWDFYKKDMARFGKVLECKAGSPDMDRPAAGKSDLACKDDPKKQDASLHLQIHDTELKVGTPDRQHIVGLKPAAGKGTEYSLVYVVTRGTKDAM